MKFFKFAAISPQHPPMFRKQDFAKMDVLLHFVFFLPIKNVLSCLDGEDMSLCLYVAFITSCHFILFICSPIPIVTPVNFTFFIISFTFILKCWRSLLFWSEENLPLFSVEIRSHACTQGSMSQVSINLEAIF